MAERKLTNKEAIIESMAHRINSEHKKHGKSEALDWAKIAALKIYSTLFERPEYREFEKLEFESEEELRKYLESI